MSAVVTFDFDKVVAKTQRKWPRARREDVEDAVGEAVAGFFEKGGDWGEGAVVQAAYWRLTTMQGRREASNVSLDAFREEDEGEAPVELAVHEDDLDSTVRLSEAAGNPVLALRLDAAQRGAHPRVAPRGANHQDARYSDEVVAEARRIRDEEKATYKAIAERLGVAHEQTVRYWCQGSSRCVETRPGWTRDLVIEAILQFDREEGRRPVETDMRSDPRLPSWTTIRRLFGSWAAALEAAGYPIKRRRQARLAKWTRRELRTALKTFFAEHGRWPRFGDFREANGLPAPPTLERLCGTTSIPKIRQLLNA